MEEFLKLYLTGDRAARMMKVKRLVFAIGIAQMIIALISYLIVAAKPQDALPIWLLLPFVILTFFAGIAVFFIGRYRVRLAYSLVEEQHEANLRECTGEEKQIYEKLYTAFAESFGQCRKFAVVFELLNVLLYVAVAVSFLITGVGAYEDGDIRVSLTMMGAVILGAILSVFTVTREGKAAGKLYELAPYEMDYVKRKYGYDEKKIQRGAQIASAQRGVVRAVELFLKDKADREEFRRVNKGQGIGALFFTAAFFVMGFLMSSFDEGGFDLMAGSVSAALFIVFLTAGICILIHTERRKRNIFFRNMQKLDFGETDTLRRNLQNECVRSSKVGNAICIGFIIVGFLAGVLLAFIGAFMGFVPETEMVEQFIGCIVGCTFLGMLVGAVGSIIAFAVYRRRVKGAERALSDVLNEEQRRLHEGQSD